VASEESPAYQQNHNDKVIEFKVKPGWRKGDLRVLRGSLCKGFPVEI